MKKLRVFYQNCPREKTPGKSRSRLTGLRLTLALLVLVAWGCGEIRPLPGAVEPKEYKEITYEQLLNPASAGLVAGQKVKVPAYFWQFLEYDPVMVRNYLNLARHPRSWLRLKWFAFYGSPEMRGYYDRAALDADRTRLYPLNRLDPVMVYGELSSLGPGLYLHVHHLEKIDTD